VKVLVDTAYLLPTIGISLNSIPETVIVELISKGFELYLNEISFSN